MFIAPSSYILVAMFAKASSQPNGGNGGYGTHYYRSASPRVKKHIFIRIKHSIGYSIYVSENHQQMVCSKQLPSRLTLRLQIRHRDKTATNIAELSNSGSIFRY